jgi:hypothetical protein
MPEQRLTIAVIQTMRSGCFVIFVSGAGATTAPCMIKRNSSIELDLTLDYILKSGKFQRDLDLGVVIDEI